MNKKEVQKRVLQFGEQISLKDFEWDEDKKIFSTEEASLILSFGDEDGITFKTGHECTFKTGDECTFNTGSRCTFDTGSYCTFETGKECIVIRRDVYEVIELEEDKTTKLNDWGKKGYTVVNNEMIEIDGKNFSTSAIKEALKEYTK